MGGLNRPAGLRDVKKVWNAIGYALLMGVCKLVGLLPYGVLYYGLAPVIHGFLHRVVRYRLGVVRKNLRGAFPERSEAERRAIERKFYRHLATMFVDTIDLSSMSRREIGRRVRYEDNERHEARVAGRSWILAMAHYGTWELTAGYPLVTDHRMGGVYRHLSSGVFERFYNHLRARFGTVPIERREVAREAALTHAGKRPPTALALIADQSPRRPIEHWFDFLNRPTGFFMGIEKLALKYDLPVYFLRVVPIKRGWYTARFEPIYDPAETVAEWEITRRYVEKLEALVREHPEYWLWSHRRWKYAPDPSER